MNDSTGWTGFKRLQDRPKSVIITKVWLLVVERLAPSSVAREREKRNQQRERVLKSIKEEGNVAEISSHRRCSAGQVLFYLEWMETDVMICIGFMDDNLLFLLMRLIKRDNGLEIKWMLLFKEDNWK